MRQFDPSARTDQTAEYWTSGHGRRLKASLESDEPMEDKQVATCISCHGKHGILAVNDPHSPVYPTNVATTCAKCHADQQMMQARMYNDRPIGHGQYDQWIGSIHGRALLEKGDLSAPTCNDCHGNHGAMPPGVASVANACGSCHGKVSKLFAQTRMKHTFEQVGLPGCATCHGAHLITEPSDEMLSFDADGLCSRCHNEDNPQYGATLVGVNTARQLQERVDQLKAEIELAEHTVEEAERLGMEVRGPRFDLRQAFDSLTNARTLIHAFSPEPVNEALNAGLDVTASVRSTAEAALREHSYRRFWLAASLVPILAVVCLLILVIRSMPIAPESESPAPGAPSP